MLLVAGALVTLSGSVIIEVSVLLLLSPIAAETLANFVLIGIGFVVVGLSLLGVGRRLPTKS
jgi:hypothetical protein